MAPSTQQRSSHAMPTRCLISSRRAGQALMNFPFLKQFSITYWQRHCSSIPRIGGPAADTLQRLLQLDGANMRRELTTLLGYGILDPALLGASTNRAVLMAPDRILREQRHTYRNTAAAIPPGQGGVAALHCQARLHGANYWSIPGWQGALQETRRQRHRRRSN